MASWRSESVIASFVTTARRVGHLSSGPPAFRRRAAGHDRVAPPPASLARAPCSTRRRRTDPAGIVQPPRASVMIAARARRASHVRSVRRAGRARSRGPRPLAARDRRLEHEVALHLEPAATARDGPHESLGSTVVAGENVTRPCRRRPRSSRLHQARGDADAHDGSRSCPAGAARAERSASSARRSPRPPRRRHRQGACRARAAD